MEFAGLGLGWIFGGGAFGIGIAWLMLSLCWCWWLVWGWVWGLAAPRVLVLTGKSRGSLWAGIALNERLAGRVVGARCFLVNLVFRKILKLNVLKYLENFRHLLLIPKDFFLNDLLLMCPFLN